MTFSHLRGKWQYRHHLRARRREARPSGGAPLAPLFRKVPALEGKHPLAVSSCKGDGRLFPATGLPSPFCRCAGPNPGPGPRSAGPGFLSCMRCIMKQQTPKTSNILRFFPFTKAFGEVPAGGGHGGHRRGGKLHDAPGHPGHGGLGHQRHPLQPARLSGGVDRIFGRAGDAAPAHCAVRGGQPGVCRHCRALQLLFPHEPGQGLRGHRGPGAGHPVRPHSAPATPGTTPTRPGTSSSAAPRTWT